MDKDKEGQSIAANLPELVLKLIFSFLSIKDLLSVQKVCTYWKYVTMDVLVWKNARFHFLEQNSEDMSNSYTIADIANVPYLHTIFGYCSRADELFEALVKHVVDLRVAVIYITPKTHMYAINFQKFVKKFKNLECIEIDNSVPAAVESLEMLSGHVNLKYLLLSCNGKVKNVNYVCEVIGYGFSALRKLHITHKHATKNSKNAIFGLLKKKINQLMELVLYDHFCLYFELISTSVKLKKLDITISECLEKPLNFEGMIGLKFLRIVVDHHNNIGSHSYECKQNYYKKIIFPRNIEYIDAKLIVNYPTGIVRNIVNSLPKLKVLKLTRVTDPDFDKQLEGINHLTDLHTVKFRRCPNLSLPGVECIMKCMSLRKFDITNLSFGDSTYENLKNCKYLRALGLYRCTLNTEKLISSLGSLKFLTDIYIMDCNISDSNGKHVTPNEVIKCIKEEQKRQYQEYMSKVLMGLFEFQE